MQIEIIIIAAIVFVVMTVGGQININQLISDNQMLFLKLKESDYDFYLRARYGNNVNTDIMFNKRIKNALIIMVLGLFIAIQNISAVTILIIFIVGYFVYDALHSSKVNNDAQEALAEFEKATTGVKRDTSNLENSEETEDENTVTTDMDANFTMKGAIGYLYAEQELNEICKIYGYGYGADTSQITEYDYGGPLDGELTGKITDSGARSITVEDINKIEDKTEENWYYDYEY